MKKILTLILIALILLFTSCTNDISAPDDTWEGIFLKFWNTMNTEYVHFSDDTSLDWDDVYDEYKEKFASLDFSSSSDTVTAFRYFKEIVWNLKDYHYTLTVSDRYGNILITKPSMLQKWVEGDRSRDIMEFPDLILTDEETGKRYYTSVKYPKYDYSREIADYNRAAIESYYEIGDLLSASSGDFYYFHTTGGSLTDDYKTSVGGSISVITSTEEINTGELSLANGWNELLNYEGITSSLDYFYGVTKDDIFYFYFSHFLGPDFLDERLTKNEGDLTEKDKQDLAANAELRKMREKIQKFNVTEESYPNIYKRFKALQSFTEMFNLVKAVARDGELTVDDASVAIKGIVMDLRGNGGGYNYFLDSLMSSFFPGEIVFGSSRYKDGYSRLEYTPWMDIYLEKTDISAECEKTYDKPFVVLVNGTSASCAELATIIVKNHLPLSAVIGQTTFGATCTLNDRTVYNGGTFSSAYFTIKTTTYQFKDSGGRSYETTGITPDYITDLERGKDNAFIAAIEWIKNR